MNNYIALCLNTQIRAIRLMINCVIVQLACLAFQIGVSNSRLLTYLNLITLCVSLTFILLAVHKTFKVMRDVLERQNLKGP